MNFQQLRSARETPRQGFNLTQVADALHTSQPGVSRQIKELEEELGVELFVRAGQDFAAADRGTLTIAATHSQARYALPHAVRDFSRDHPEVTLHMHQGSPQQVAELLLADEADIGIATEALAEYPDLVALPCYRWTHAIVVPHGHPLVLDTEPPSLQRLAQFPIVTYERGYTGRRHIDEAFRREGLALDLVLSAMDADVIKTYVELGMGVGLIASIAYDESRDSGLHAIDARHLFATNLTRLAIRRGAFLRSYLYEFIRGFAPTLTREVVDRALATPPGTVVAV